LKERASPHGKDRRRVRLIGWLYPAFAFLCLMWLAARSGRKPSRLRYPCQQAAAVHATWLLGALGAGLVHAVGRKRGWRL